MSKLIGSWSFYKKTILIAVPIMVQNLITNLVAMIDNIMVGQVGTEQMSAVAIVNQLFFVFNLTIFGSLSGAGIFSAQFFGKEDIDGVRHTMRFKFMTATVITAIGILVFLFAGDSLVELYLHDTTEDIDLEKTFMYAKDYMLIMLVGLVPFAYEQVYSSTLREGGITTPSMVAGIVAVLTNVGLNTLLIFGIGVFPKLGVAGAAIATVISRFVQVAIVILYAHINSWRLTFIQGLYKSLSVPSKLVKVIMIKGLLPLTANECLWAAGTAALAQCYSVRGLEVVAAQNIASTVVNLFNVMFIAFGSGVSVVIGQMLGANDMKNAKESAPKLVFFAAAMCVVIGGVMACFAGIFPHAYNTTDDVRALATAFILISAALMPLHSALHSMYFIVRSGGKTLLTFACDCGFSWVVSVPLAHILANYTSLSIIPLYAICMSSELLKCFIFIFLIKKGVWLSNIVNDTNAQLA